MKKALILMMVVMMSVTSVYAQANKKEEGGNERAKFSQNEKRPQEGPRGQGKRGPQDPRFKELVKAEQQELDEIKSKYTEELGYAKVDVKVQKDIIKAEMAKDSQLLTLF